MVEYRHAVKVSDIACRCAKEVGYRANLCLAGGFYYRMGRWIGEPYIKNAVNKAESLCFPAELISILAEYYGEEQLPKENGFILFPNHQGFFDMLAIIDTCPKPLGVIIKKEAANWILVKQVLRLLGGIPMDRSDIRAAMEVIKEMTRQVKEGKTYVIFPEGTRSRKGNELLEFKAGTFKSAINAGCPIVPVALINSFRPFDISSIKKEQVEVHYLEPIYKEQYIGLKTREIADLVHDRIQAEIDRCIKVAK